MGSGFVCVCTKGGVLVGIWPLLFLAGGLAADAVTVAVANGIRYPRHTLRLALCCGVLFGLFQGVMPVVGYLAGHSFFQVIGGIGHWVAAGLLGIIGGRMIREALRSLRRPGENPALPSITGGALLLQAFATSADALAVGIGLGVLGANVAAAALVIGGVTFVGSFLGVLLGKAAGRRFAEKAQLLGGFLLLLIGLHILAEHAL